MSGFAPFVDAPVDRTGTPERGVRNDRNFRKAIEVGRLDAPGWDGHHPNRIAYQSAVQMSAPMPASEVTVGVKYGYSINARPATSCGGRACFLPYTNSTNPMPPGINERNSQVAVDS